MAAALQRKSSGGITFVKNANISLAKENAPGSCFVVVLGRMEKLVQEVDLD